MAYEFMLNEIDEIAQKAQKRAERAENKPCINYDPAKFDDPYSDGHNDDLIRRADAFKVASNTFDDFYGTSPKRDVYLHFNIGNIPAADVLEIPLGGIGEVSDGYHTFNSLYNQRLYLFAALCNAYPNKAWKSKLHEDGTEPFSGGWFIVGIDTPQGSYTYHYELKDWDLFKCPEIERGKPWDGHTDKDVARLLSLPADVRPVVLCKNCEFTETDGMEEPAIYCQKWDRWEMPPDGYCYLGKSSNCCADMREGDHG